MGGARGRDAGWWVCSDMLGNLLRRVFMIVAARILGSKRTLFADWSVPLPPRDSRGGDGGLTLRELIEYVVEAEVGAFLERQEDRRLDRVLSVARIAEGEGKGI